MKLKTDSQWLDKIISVLFVALLALPLCVTLTQSPRSTSEVEMRKLAVLPTVPSNVSELNNLPNAIAQYYADHFGFREQLTNHYFRLIKKINRAGGVNDVTVGRDGWLFLGSYGSGERRYRDPIGDAMHVNLYTEAELAAFAKSISELNQWLAAQGIAYLYVIAPNKHSIYFDRLPDYIKKQNPKSATDQLYEYLRSNTNVPVVDLRPALNAARQQQQVYYKTDTHWNYLGANVAQFEIMKAVKVLRDRAMPARLLDANQFIERQKDDGDLARMMGGNPVSEVDPRPVFEDACEPVAERDLEKHTDTQSYHCDSGALNALIFRDSFFSALQPFIARYFERSTYIWQGASRKALDKYIVIDKPDIVIEETVERTLPYIHSVYREYLDEA